MTRFSCLNTGRGNKLSVFCCWELKPNLTPPAAPRPPKLQRSGVWFWRDKEIKRSWVLQGEAMAAVVEMTRLRKKISEKRSSHSWKQPLRVGRESTWLCGSDSRRHPVTISPRPLFPPSPDPFPQDVKRSHLANWHGISGMPRAEGTAVWGQWSCGMGWKWDVTEMCTSLCAGSCVTDSYIPCHSIL